MASFEKFKCDHLGTAALVPWIPARKVIASIPKSGKKKEESQVENMKHQVHETFARAFPFYLPGVYHQMDSVMMMSSGTGNYWINASHFFKMISDFGTIPFYNIKRGVPFCNDIKASTELCKTAEEFLLEPWVLLQLPFQPALLHQWAVAALAETLRFCKRLVEINSRGYAPQFHDLYMKLARLSQSLYKNCHCLLAHFFLVYCEKPQETEPFKARRILPEFQVQLRETLAGLEFILSSDCTEILNVIKRKSWSKTNSPLDLQFSPDASEIGCFRFDLEQTANVYSHTYWEFTPNVKRLCSELKKIEDTRFTVMANAAEKFLSEHDPEMAKNPLNHLKDVAKNQILAKTQLKGMKNADALIEGLDENLGPEALKVFQQHAFIKLYFQENGEYPTRGIISQLLGLQADVFAEFSLGTMTRLLWRAAKTLDDEVFLDSAKIPMPMEFSVKSFEEKIEKALTSRTAHWETKTILARAKASCGTFEDDWTTFLLHVPDRNKIQNQSTVDFMTMMNRRILLAMLSTHHASLQGGGPVFEYYPENLTVQYIVPCFAAMYLNSMIDPRVDEASMDLGKFVRFLRENYKAQAYILKLKSGQRKQQFFISETQIDRVAKITKMENRLRSMFKESTYMQKYILSGFSHLGDGAAPVVPINHSKPELFTPSYSDLQIWWLSCRWEEALVAAGREPRGRFADFTAQDLRVVIDFLKKFHSLDCLLDFVQDCRQKSVKLDKRLGNHTKLKGMLRDAKSLTPQQLDAIAVFIAMNSNAEDKGLFEIYDEPIFQLDDLNGAAVAIIHNHWFNVKTLMNHVLKVGEGDDEEPGMIPFDVAKNNKCCGVIMKGINSAGRLKGIPPGTVLLYPIRHCRWCHLVYCRSFRLCRECKQEPSYPLKTYFCSEKCESAALNACHMEEHAKFVMMNVGVRADAI